MCVLLYWYRWCGRSQTLMITSKSSSEGNGTAASAASPQAQEREQEMVTLMNKEKIQENGNTEEFTVITLEESPEKNQQAWKTEWDRVRMRGGGVGEREGDGSWLKSWPAVRYFGNQTDTQTLSVAVGDEV